MNSVVENKDDYVNLGAHTHTAKKKECKNEIVKKVKYNLHW